MRHVVSAVLALSVASAPAAAHAFCGFYVSGADASLYNNATMVVMMRDGQKTVLSMQNSYQGPPEDFALVVPVPVVLQEENVKTLPREVFTHVDQLAAPRLVEYWEQDPCQPQVMPGSLRFQAGSGGPQVRRRGRAAADLGVTVEAQFQVGEYDIVILSATDSSGLDTWLRQEQYNIPAGAAPVLRPYVEAGTKFFVAKVDVERVTFEDGKAVLSPLRFHYDSPEFNLPVRLGLLNSGGNQDLIVHILARGQRYEVANYENATIPTNIRVVDAVRDEFGPFYDLLFRRTVANNPRTVVTEYAWDASSCDPCPTPPLSPAELMTLGGDVISGAPSPVGRGRGRFGGGGFVLTRLHYRYRPATLGEDLVFRAAPPIIGGRGMPSQDGTMSEEGAQPSSMNNFQGRYIILHPWEGAVACENPHRGSWGGPPGQPTPRPFAAGNQAMGGSGTRPAARRTGPALASIGPVVRDSIPAVRVQAGVAEQALPGDPGPPGARGDAAPPAPNTPPTPMTPTAPATPPAAAPPRAADSGCTVGAVGDAAGSGAIAGVLMMLAVAAVRRRRA